MSQGAEHLAEDHAAVAAGPEQGALAKRGQGGREVGVGAAGPLDGLGSRRGRRTTVRYMLVPVSPSGTG